MLDYVKEEKEELRKNILLIREEIKKGIGLDLTNKIKRFALKYDLSEKLIKQKVQKDDLFVLCFIKEPNRQSFHQRLAAEFIKSIPNINNFKLLPPGGAKALYIISGQLQDGKNITTSKKPKSIDFVWKYETQENGLVEFYATHKYTKEGGGAQDNQFNDIKLFLDNAQSYNRTDKFFIAICDGAYYNQLPYIQNKINYSNKISYLERIYGGLNKRVKVLEINQLQEFLESL
jgi:hypothetical protein